MKQYLIEMSASNQQVLASLTELSQQIVWGDHFVTDDKIYFLCLSPDETVLNQQLEAINLNVDKVAHINATVKSPTFENETWCI